MSEVTGTYRYSPISESQIRLLKLDPVPPEGSSDYPLSGELSVFRLTVGGSTDPNEAKPYDALSYTWGGTKKSTENLTITIYQCVDSNNGRRRKLGTILITPNLDQALRQFRAEVTRDILYLWIDSICIQQEGAGYGHEKGAQIRKMHDIYSEANMVRIWLGPDDLENSIESYHLIKDILALNNFNNLCTATEYAPRWDTFIKLMQRAWFQRRWIVQEVAFASSATVYWGSQSVSWSEFASAVQLFASKKGELRAMFQRSSHANHNANYMGEIEALAAAQLVTTLDLLFRTSKDGNIMEKLLSLETLLTNMTAFDVSRPHDTVYAVMQLSNNAIPVSLEPSFSASSSSSDEEQASPQATILTDRKVEEPQIIITNPSEPATESPPLPTTRAAVDGERSNSADLESPTDVEVKRGRTLGHHSTPSTSSLFQVRARSPDPFVAEARRRAEDARVPTRFVVDYDKSLFSLCTEIIKFCVEESKSIDIICRAWVPSIESLELYSPNGDLQFPLHDVDKVTLPSWMCSVDNRPHEAVQVETSNQDAALSNQPQHYRLSRINADSLVGSGFTASKAYSASGKVQVDLTDIRIDDRIFEVKGFELAIVDKINDTATDAIIPGKWLKLASDSPRVDSLPDDFWRTLVGNRESSDTTKPATQYWRQACNWVFSSRAYSPNHNINISEIIQNISGSIPEPVVSFLTRVRTVVWNKKLFRSRDKSNEGLGLLGLAPDTAQNGDIICILKGCSVPLLLRPKDRSRNAPRSRSLSLGAGSPQPNGRIARRRRAAPSETRQQQNTHIASPEAVRGSHSSTESQARLDASPRSTLDSDINVADEYSIIGECYLHGMMDGEAFAEQKKYNLPDKTFKLGCAVECNCRKCEICFI